VALRRLGLMLCTPEGERRLVTARTRPPLAAWARDQDQKDWKRSRCARQTVASGECTVGDAEGEAGSSSATSEWL